MNQHLSPEPHTIETAPSSDDFLREVVTGLTATPKRLPSKFFYDRAGAKLFEEICTLPEYYPTQTEISILNDNLPEMVRSIGPGAIVIEYGSGSSTKTRLLLDHLDKPAAYIPIDIAGEQLRDTSRALQKRFPAMRISPVIADYESPLQLPEVGAGHRIKVVYFPGSTIGNFRPEEARRFLARMARLVRPDGIILIGVDLVKDPAILHAAYNDSKGVTAAFNKNVLHRIVRTCNTNLDPEAFVHYAFYNPYLKCVEMHLVSLYDQVVYIGDDRVQFEQGESIQTEWSFKYSLKGFEKLAKSAGLRRTAVWTDPDEYFSVQLLQPLLSNRAV